MDAELELVRQAARGSADAFEQLVLNYQTQIYNLTLRMTGSPEDALDLSQEAFLKAWRGLASYRFDSAFSTWLYRLASNVCIDFLRRQKKQKTVPLQFSEDGGEARELSVPDPAPGPEETLLARAAREQVAAALARLEPEYREALTLRVVNGLSYAEIAAILHIREGTVKSRIARAREKMRAAMEKTGNKTGGDSSKRTERKGGSKRHEL